MDHKNNIDILTVLKKAYCSKLHDWMKIQFSDVCSNGDVIINNILDKLNKKDDITENELLYIKYIYDTYDESYLIDEKPDPRWAD